MHALIVLLKLPWCIDWSGALSRSISIFQEQSVTCSSLSAETFESGTKDLYQELRASQGAFCGAVKEVLELTSSFSPIKLQSSLHLRCQPLSEVFLAWQRIPFSSQNRYKSSLLVWLEPSWVSACVGWTLPPFWITKFPSFQLRINSRVRI